MGQVKMASKIKITVEPDKGVKLTMHSEFLCEDVAFHMSPKDAIVLGYSLVSQGQIAQTGGGDSQWPEEGGE